MFYLIKFKTLIYLYEILFLIIYLYLFLKNMLNFNKYKLYIYDITCSTMVRPSVGSLNCELLTFPNQ